MPQTLEGWSDFFPRYTTLPWLKGRDHQRVQTMREYLRLAFHRVPIGVRRKTSLEKTLHALLAVCARWRLDHDFYSCPFEIYLKNRVESWTHPPKPKVDAHQLAAEPVTC